MRTTLTLLFLLFGAGLLLYGQEGIPGADIWRAPSDPPVVQGCLRSVATRYVVVANDGTFTRLTGNTASLSRYVGHEVEIHGKPTVITLDTTAKDAASTVEELPALEVKTAKELKATCSTSIGAPGR